MRAKEILIERATSILFHYTSIEHARSIVKSGVFQLASTTGAKSEESYAPPGHPFFLSLTRTSHGDYHNYVGTGAVLFKLNGGSYHRDEDGGLGVDLSNARKPDSGDRESAVKLIKYMQSNGIKSTVDLKNSLVDKWDALIAAKNKQ